MQYTFNWFKRGQLNLSLAKIPSVIKEFNLSNIKVYENNNDDSQLKADELIAIINAPKTIENINLSMNSLGGYRESRRLFTANELIAIIKALPRNLTTLNLSNNYLHHLSADNLVDVIKVLPPGLKSLNLSSNEFEKYSSIDLVKILQALPEDLQSLQLDWKNLYRFSAKEFIQILQALPKNLLSFGPNNIELKVFTTQEIIQILKMLPTHLNSLDLRWNRLGNKTVAELIDIFTAIPASVITLNLSGNNFNAQQLDAIMNVLLPAGVETIILDNKIIDRNEYYAEHLFVEVAHCAATKGMKWWFALDNIKPPIEIDGNRLNRVIEFLEKENNPIADLTCGLLLEGRIETTTEILENCSEYDEHRERRNHDAISYYTKAAHEPIIKPIAEFLLWEMKTTSPFASIQIRLAQYDVSPKATTIFDSFSTLANGRQVIINPLLANLGMFALPSKSEPTIGFNTKIEPSSPF